MSTDPKKRIVLSALKLFAQKGKHGARMDEIAAEAEVNKAMIYYYYTNRDTLFKEVMRHVLISNAERIEQYMNELLEQRPAHDPLEIIKAFVMADNRALFENREGVRFVVGALVNEPNEVRPVIQEVYDQMGETNIKEMVFKAIEKGIENGQFRPVDPRQVLLTIIGANFFYPLTESFACMLTGIDVENERRFMQERRDSIVDTLLNGIRTKPGEARQQLSLF